eukprot:TRINITY_DN386_c1_g1_i2.p4 TRINITY_DN386_c1_g1~~TRINITY_DN386_c1_g1_i2.p4  ORF type:complete len:112 (-),score=21.73 TRINITY_DN386_c1_g1_i2:1135-1470(-)
MSLDFETKVIDGKLNIAITGWQPEAYVSKTVGTHDECFEALNRVCEGEYLPEAAGHTSTHYRFRSKDTQLDKLKEKGAKIDDVHHANFEALDNESVPISFGMHVYRAEITC